MSHGNTRAATGTRVAPSDIDLFTQLENNLYTAVVSDALDDLGVRDRVMADHLRPLAPAARFAGYARTISCMDVHHLDGDPYATEIEAVDSILPGEVVVVSTGGSRRNAPWGELLSTAALARGARGAVIDGLVRDVECIRRLGFPVFSAGSKPVDSKGRGLVVAYNVPVQCGAVLVSPRDLIFADFDGVVAIPASVIEAAVRLATEKASREDQSRDELRKSAYLRDVYKKYGVL